MTSPKWTVQAAILELAAVVEECPPETRQDARDALEWLCGYCCDCAVDDLAEGA